MAGSGFSIEWTYPAGLLSQADSKQALLEAGERRLGAAMARFTEDVRGETPYQTIAEAYAVQSGNDGQSVPETATNDSGIWQFREDDVVPHWAPWGEDTPLAKWAQAHDMPAFLVARKIAEEGIEGNHIVREQWNAHEPALWQAMEAVVSDWIAQQWSGRAN